MNAALWNAYWDVERGMPILQAAHKHGVSCTTLWQRRKSLIPKKVGGQTVFSDYDEHILATLLRSFEAFNLPLTRDDFKDKCRTLAKKRGTCVLQKKLYE